MNKATNLLFTGAFSLGCVALWMVLALYGGIYGSLFHHVNQVLFTKVLIECRVAILFLPIPSLLYCAFAMFRKPLSPEGVMLHGAILAIVFMTLFLLVSAAVLLPMVPYSDNLAIMLG